MTYVNIKQLAEEKCGRIYVSRMVCDGFAIRWTKDDTLQGWYSTEEQLEVAVKQIVFGVKDE